MARRYDPERRQRIIDAAIRVVGAKGIAGLSHRSVAAEADVPLGSTTYHFKTLDDLLVAALRQANEGFAGLVAGREALTDPEADLPAELAALLGEWLAGDRTGVELEYELYLAALRRPALRPVAAEWTEDVAEHLARRTDPSTARALLALMDGICLQVLLTGRAYDEGWAREVLGRVVPPTAGVGLAPAAGAAAPPEAGIAALPVVGAAAPPEVGAATLPVVGVASPPVADAATLPEAGVASPPAAGAATLPVVGVATPPEAGIAALPVAGAATPPEAGAATPPQAGAATPPQAGAATPPQVGVVVSPAT